MDEKVIYEHETESKLKKLDDRINVLKSNAKALEAKAKKSYNDKVEKLLLKKHNVEEELRKMRSAGADAWIGIKTGIDKAFEEIDHGFKSAAAKLKDLKEKA